MPAPVIPALIGAATSVGTFLAQAAPVIGAVGSIAGPMIASSGSAKAAQLGIEGARIAAAGRSSTPGGQIIAGPSAGMAQSAAAPAKSPNPYNSAQKLATAPSLVGTGSGFNASSASGQPKQEEGTTGVQ